ncbi:MAG: ATP-NAD kinase [Chloroflexi bacterium]|nr:ATP-NAD kinase [Chloroflexota bacterium]MBT4142849.1 ATP-NAD kinase [Chloroflexota bacterium]MBT7078349.1 ATP-NAD kinase [Chloroflexota bacterium]
MSTVGIIANPAAGKDIRRLVAHGRVVSNQEKANILRRVFAGVVSTGADRLLVMPDHSGLARPAANDVEGQIKIDYVEMPVADHQGASTNAARAMAEQGADSIVTLGGDGTNRVVAKGAGTVPLVPISTGTNNVFPANTEGTLAGIAAGAMATGALTIEEACRRSKRIDIYVNGERRDDALVDAVVSNQMFVGARAVWDTKTLQSMFLTRAEPASIGLSSIGSRIMPISIDQEYGLYIRLTGEPGENATTVRAPIAPGTIVDVEIMEWRKFYPGDKIAVDTQPGTFALDGEREVELLPGHDVYAALATDGPWVVDVPLALTLLATK